jgi:hypothetical protein
MGNRKGLMRLTQDANGQSAQFFRQILKSVLFEIEKCHFELASVILFCKTFQKRLKLIPTKVLGQSIQLFLVPPNQEDFSDPPFCHQLFEVSPANSICTACDDCRIWGGVGNWEERSREAPVQLCL